MGYRSTARKSKNLVLYSIRHGFVVRMLDIGIPLEVISKYVGHLDVKTTMIYAHAKERVEKYLPSIQEKINEEVENEK